MKRLNTPVCDGTLTWCKENLSDVGDIQSEISMHTVQDKILKIRVCPNNLSKLAKTPYRPK